MLHDLVRALRREVMVVDPISNLSFERAAAELKPTLKRLIDFLKTLQITSAFTDLSSDDSEITTQENSQFQ